jgi:hypothetical protein
MNTTNKDFKLGFDDGIENQPMNFDGIADRAEYLRGYRDAQEQDALAFAGANDHA